MWTLTACGADAPSDAGASAGAVAADGVIQDGGARATDAGVTSTTLDAATPSDAGVAGEADSAATRLAATCGVLESYVPPGQACESAAAIHRGDACSAVGAPCSFFDYDSADPDHVAGPTFLCDASCDAFDGGMAWQAHCAPCTKTCPNQDADAAVYDVDASDCAQRPAQVCDGGFGTRQDALDQTLIAILRAQHLEKAFLRLTVEFDHGCATRFYPQTPSGSSDQAAATLGPALSQARYACADGVLCSTFVGPYFE